MKKQKILIILLLILFLLILYLIFTSEPVKQINNPEQQIKQDNSVLLEANYKPKVKEIFVAYEELIKNGNYTQENIADLKNKLFNLKGIPKKFQNLHWQFFSALNKMEDYLSQKDEQKKSDSLQTISQLKADYSWLN